MKKPITLSERPQSLALRRETAPVRLAEGVPVMTRPLAPMKAGPEEAPFPRVAVPAHADGSINQAVSPSISYVLPV